jgi:hypothetical protein
VRAYEFDDAVRVGAGAEDCQTRAFIMGMSSAGMIPREGSVIDPAPLQFLDNAKQLPVHPGGSKTSNVDVLLKRSLSDHL